MDDKILIEHRETWKRKPVLREIYEDFYRRIVCYCRPGRSLEVGGGSGNFKEFIGDVLSTDIIPAPWLDTVADAQALPFSDAKFANVVGMDVLHHIERPVRFLREVTRVLQPGGRLVLVEPAITPLSWWLYRFFHPEPVNMNVDPLRDGPIDPKRLPFDSNQAIPTLLFGSYLEHLNKLFPLLRIVHLERFSFFAYPLSGGFRPWSLIPARMVRSTLAFECALAPIIGRLMAFRLFIVLEKLPVSEDIIDKVTQ
jgi:SAM-dependent methyltransferase